MRNLTLAVVLALGLGHGAPVNAGIVDITYIPTTGDVFLRTDVGIALVAAALQFGGGASGTFTLAPGATFPLDNPPNVSDTTSVLDVAFMGDLFVQLNPPVEFPPAEYIHTDGLTLLVGNFSGAVATSFDCSGCAGLFGMAVVDANLGDLSAQTSYIVPEPKIVLLLGLAVAGFLVRRRAYPG